jgi:hypothetical protein
MTGVQNGLMMVAQTAEGLEVEVGGPDFHQMEPPHTLVRSAGSV